MTGGSVSDENQEMYLIVFYMGNILWPSVHIRKQTEKMTNVLGDRSTDRLLKQFGHPAMRPRTGPQYPGLLGAPQKTPGRGVNDPSRARRRGIDRD